MSWYWSTDRVHTLNPEDFAEVNRMDVQSGKFGLLPIESAVLLCSDRSLFAIVTRNDHCPPFGNIGTARSQKRGLNVNGHVYKDLFPHRY